MRYGTDNRRRGGIWPVHRPSVEVRLYRGWRIELRMKTQGQTIKRTVCTLRLVYDDPQWDEQLTGFSSPAQAWAEAQKRIDYLLDLSGRIRQEYPWPRIRYDEDAA